MVSIGYWYYFILVPWFLVIWVQVLCISVVSKRVLWCIVQRFKNESQFRCQTADQCMRSLVLQDLCPENQQWERWESIVLYRFLATEEVHFPSADGATLQYCPAFSPCKYLWTCCYTPDLCYRRALCQSISTCTRERHPLSSLTLESIRLIHGNLGRSSTPVRTIARCLRTGQNW